jgi:WD40 repeat protein/serine/threonine protein kinase
MSATRGEESAAWNGVDADLADWVADLSDRLEQGEPIDLDALAEVRPGQAEELRRLLPTTRRMASFGRAVAREPGAGRPPVGPALGVLGDFRLIREVGRGGMGIVYKAEQISLRRRVALKVLPLAGALDPRHHQRFLHEARAAACLHHPHIVPVYAVGSERGVPYYAMQFIDGCTLAQVLQQLPGRDPRAALGPPTAVASQEAATAPGGRESAGASPPAPSSPCSLGKSNRDRTYIRAVAEHGRRAAEALDHAHGRGILHRDIKPANLMLDVAGHLWVADFGLAQIQGDSRLTLTGDVVGTLRYMSPEQALAKRVVVDGRTDIYSLGATLYELLALRPVFDGNDRAELLCKISLEEPTPLRRLNPAVPQDLEIIVHKTLAKEPSERYATAQELADDLGRFLAARPIAARRPGTWERLGRWGRRHRAVVGSAMLFAALALVASAAGLVWSNHWLSRHGELLQVERDRAERLSAQLKDQRDLAERRRRLADRHLNTFRLRQASEAVRARQLEKAQEILRDCRPAPGEDDPREFAWHYLWREARREVAVLSGRDEQVQALAVSADGRTVATGDRDGTIRLRDAGTGALVRRFPRRDLPIAALAFSPDGGRLASGTSFKPGDAERRGGELLVWDTASGRPIARLDGFGRRTTTHLRFSPSGESLWERSQQSDDGGEVGLWVLGGVTASPGPRLVRRWESGWGLTISADGRRVAAYEEGGRVAVVEEPATGRLLRRLPRAASHYRGLGLSADGRLVATAAADPAGGPLAIAVWEVETGRRLVERRDGPSGWLADPLEFGPDGRSLVARGFEGGLRHYALDTGQTWVIPNEPASPGRFVGDTSLLPGGVLLVHTPRGKPPGWLPLEAYDRASGARRGTFPGRPDVTSHRVGFPEGRSLAFRSGARAVVWHIEPPADPQPAGHSDEAWAVAFSGDGRRLATGSDDTDDPQTLKVWDAATGRLVRGWRAHDATTAAVAFQPGGRMLATAALMPTPNLRLWDAETGGLLATLDGHTDRVRSVAFRPDGRVLASAGSDRVILLWDVAARRRIAALTGHTDTIRQIAFAPDGRTLASVGTDATVRLWDVGRAQMAWAWEGDVKVAAVAFAPHGRTLAWALEDGVIERLDLASKRLLAPVHSEYDELRCLAFAPDGRTLAAAGKSGAVHLWDPELGQELVLVEGPPHQANALAFSPDGSALAACWHDGTVRIMRARPASTSEP